ncbi:putative permease [Anaerohalosphaera lusitana]|uniref:Putative permease n=1 Tax=Anaerohalosphaera lusitana TaxID=1936003 RepID=A0A1U9NJE2_9BACT|nr:permease [Anaerohalosphaera lusitana]AQT68031.1 putative permease [Anaerohalosphaera lusitana]
MLTVLIKTLLEAAPYIVLGFLVAGIIRELVPRDVLSKHLGAKGLRPLLKSVGIGSLLPLCSCGTIPLGIGLYRCGAAVGSILAFITSSPVLSPLVVILSMKLLGFKMAGMLLGFSLLTSFFVGLGGNAIFKGGDRESAGRVKSYEPIRRNESGGAIMRILRWSFRDFGGEASIDILIGLAVASAIISILPSEWISTWLGKQQLSTLIYVIIIGIPVYACSVPSVPIVQGLLLMGATPGAAIAYMLAGPATNLGELNAIRRHMGKWTAGYYSAGLIVFSLFAGLVTDKLIFPDYQYAARLLDNGELVVSQCCVPLIFGTETLGKMRLESVPLWHWPFGVLLAVILVLGAIKRVGEFVTDPCGNCVWREYGENTSCGGRCHVRRKHEWLRKLWPGR